ncbi:hypothetical protein [Amycolatopsis saalfeldensis]|uniref:Peptidase S53 domain-containing protein n=1 Tax=Amycolatopsis saalfeldensis TaxID=394193 RepID=A0A1H8V0V1_9PSEU|nr:hypothetical protein [Amycolatopsis saalfeldensis]SEP09130.1 hypothetical protein SAMN04489732_103586 [Amycolatopsis saalfeldensis]
MFRPSGQPAVRRARLPETGGAGETIAIVDAGDSPTAEADLAVYRQTYGLTPCTTANGCFRKVNQHGAAAPLPPVSGTWPVEIALDLDLASAACGQCRILLVLGDDASFDSLGTAVDTAVALGATVVSTSYGAPESRVSGDEGFTVPNAPAVYGNVVAVGGTSLTRSANARGWTESAWRKAASGCSARVAKPAWQAGPNCPGRTVADVSAVADPETGPAVYETTVEPGWAVIGGTSASSRMPRRSTTPSAAATPRARNAAATTSAPPSPVTTGLPATAPRTAWPPSDAHCTNSANMPGS